ncbi:MAG TPA: hypothetical protein VLF14_07635 [Candidatus Binatia bacterium]|nr:hypothetical protein [Candidatus Binatia bacterium]
MERVFDLLPTKDQLSEAIGLRTAPSSISELGTALAIFTSRLLAGGALALLFAPLSGRQLRAELRERVDEARRRVRSPENERSM